jgi:hypothetical protein
VAKIALTTVRSWCTKLDGIDDAFTAGMTAVY